MIVENITIVGRCSQQDAALAFISVMLADDGKMIRVPRALNCTEQHPAELICFQCAGRFAIMIKNEKSIFHRERWSPIGLYRFN